LSNQSAFHRRRAPSACFRLAVKGVARRRLQSLRSTSTTGISRAPFGVPKVSLGRASWVARPLAGTDQPSFLGSGARFGFRRIEHPPVAIARTEVGYPDPRGPDTFCRERVAETAGGAAPARCTKRTPVTCPPGEPACARPAAGDPTFARPSDRAASRDPPRRGVRSAEPKVPSVVDGSPGGEDVFG